jgi:CRP/FNR family transcriptional regulator
MDRSQTHVHAPLDFLSLLEEPDRSELYQLGITRSLAKNDFIFKAGVDDSSVYVLQHGRARIFGTSAEGRDLILWFAMSGEIFGLAESLLETRRAIYARAAEPSEVLCIAHGRFKQWLSVRPDAAFGLMKIMALRMRDLGQRFLSLANGNVRREIAQLLVRLSATYGRSTGPHIHMCIPLTEQDIADMVGTTRQAVSGCLADLKRQDIISIERRFLTIKRPKDLENMAQGLEGLSTAALQMRKEHVLERMET